MPSSVLSFFARVSALLALAAREAAACTALAIDGAASVTGAAFTSENVDCDNCDFRLAYVPPGDHAPGAKRPVYLQKAAYPRFVGHGRGEIYHPVGDQVAFEPAAFIEQVPHTFGYYESACPLLNDQGLGIAESSCAAMLLNKAPDDKSNRSAPVGLLDAAAVMQIVLERCSTARCGAEVIGQLCESHGYLPFFGEPTQGITGRGGRKVKTEWDDAGEAYTLADASGEAWVVHVLGGVEGIIQSVWAAQRVPKGHVAPVANEFTIAELPDEPNEDFLFSKDIFRAAKAANLWDGKCSLHFSRVFAPSTLYESAPATGTPDPLYGSLRKWRLLNLVAPSLNLKFEMDSLKLPFSVKAERKLSHRDVFEMMRDHYAGTEFDMTKGMLAGPFGTPFRLEGGPSFAQVPRGISIMRAIYGMVAQTGPEGSVVWFASDTPATSVYLPLDAKSSALSPAMHTGTYLNYTRESMFWAFDFVSNWMQLNHQAMSREDVRPRQDSWQDRIDLERSAMMKRSVSADELDRWQVELQERLRKDWWNLADELVVKWNDGERSDDKRIGASWSYPPAWARMVGMSNDIHPLWVEPASSPPAPEEVDGYVPAMVSLPRGWDKAARSWTDFSRPGKPDALAASWTTGDVALFASGAAVTGLALFAAGASVGLRAGRRQAVSAQSARWPLLA
eukprot:TRINITY_DN6915_c0_g1_i1.p1 TRINITY_DN6915_c0_g1~~TRINITY_DN6915_c0_g1_i1.p1  ORF type:complete len:687 (+),score=139.80 TRINITY_DN6915_c0_g1_i1:34-2061(+)